MSRCRRAATPGHCREELDRSASPPFWRVKTLDQMSSPSGRACATAAPVLPRQARGRGHRRNPLHRHRLQAARRPLLPLPRLSQPASQVHDCVKLTPKAVRELTWLPVTCAYRRLHEGRGLAWWHPLVSGRAETVEEAGVSARGRSSRARPISIGTLGRAHRQLAEPAAAGEESRKPERKKNPGRMARGADLGEDEDQKLKRTPPVAARLLSA